MYYYLTVLIRESSVNRNGYNRVTLLRGKRKKIVKIEEFPRKTINMHIFTPIWSKFPETLHFCLTCLWRHNDVTLWCHWWKTSKYDVSSHDHAKIRHEIRSVSVFDVTLVPFFAARWRHIRVFGPIFFNRCIIDQWIATCKFHWATATGSEVIAKKRSPGQILPPPHTGES